MSSKFPKCECGCEGSVCIEYTAKNVWVYDPEDDSLEENHEDFSAGDLIFYCPDCGEVDLDKENLLKVKACLEEGEASAVYHKYLSYELDRLIEEA